MAPGAAEKTETWDIDGTSLRKPTRYARERYLSCGIPVLVMVKPKIKISLMSQYERPHSQQHILLCSVNGFYPSEIEVKWYRNNQEQTEKVEFTEPHHNGDWSYQMEVMLETEIQKGDTFTCEVQHDSLKELLRVNWHPQTSDAAKNKMATGIVGIVLGLVFLIVGLVIYMRGRKVQSSFPGHQNERFLPQ